MWSEGGVWPKGRGACLVRGWVSGQGVGVWSEGEADIPLRDGYMHPTGMHSCLNL